MSATDVGTTVLEWSQMKMGKVWSMNVRIHTILNSLALASPMGAWSPYA